MELREIWPAVNSSFNAIAFVFLCLGWRAVKARRLDDHKRWMLAAFAASTVFLISYLAYHGTQPTTKFTTPGWPKTVYFVVLFTHIPLAALMVPPILRLLFLAFRGRLADHKKLARITLPVWMYVSVTGVLVYLMLYHIWPGSPAS